MRSDRKCSPLSLGSYLLFSFAQEYRRGLSQYCQLLDQKLPKKQEGQALTQSQWAHTSIVMSERLVGDIACSCSAVLFTLDLSFFLCADEIVLSCYIINTCEYVQETLPGLGERMATLIEAPYKDQIDLGPLGDEFGACIAAAVAVLVASMWTKLNKVLAGMTRLPWATWSSVGDESPYVSQCALIFREELPLVAAKLSPRYHPFFCSQIASTFIPRFVDSIYRCKRIGEMGAQQMSLDAHALKNVLLGVPSISSAGAGDASSAGGASARAPGASAIQPSHRSFHKYVNTEMSKAEALIKTLVSPNERLIVTFKALLPKSNVDDLMRVRETHTFTHKTTAAAAFACAWRSSCWSFL